MCLTYKNDTQRKTRGQNMAMAEIIATHAGVPVENVRLTEEGFKGVKSVRVFSVSDGREFLVTPGDIASKKLAKITIQEMAWAFDAEFILKHSKIDTSADTITALKKVQRALCEEANPIILAMIKVFDKFAQDAIATDGIGHFLSPYDGQETKTKDGFCIYRLQ